MSSASAGRGVSLANENRLAAKIVSVRRQIVGIRDVSTRGPRKYELVSENDDAIAQTRSHVNQLKGIHFSARHVRQSTCSRDVYNRAALVSQKLH